MTHVFSFTLLNHITVMTLGGCQMPDQWEFMSHTYPSYAFGNEG